VGPSYIYSHIATFFPENVKDYIRTFIPGQTFKLLTKVSDSKDFKTLKIFRRLQIFSLEISGPKVVLDLLCKCLLYRRSGLVSEPGPRGFSLTSFMDDPALEIKMHLCVYVTLSQN